MNIAYILWVERLNSPIIKSQVIDILEEIGNHYNETKIYLIAFQPFYHTFIFRHEYHSLKNNLLKNNVHLIIINCFSFPKVDWFNAKWYVMPIIFVQMFPILLYLIYKKNINIIHCRSYPSMLPSFFLKKLYPNLKMIFDPRSPFPEENVLAGNWNAKSISYKLWKKFECIFLKSSDATVAITGTYVSHFSSIYEGGNYFPIPNNVDVEKFSIDEKLRDELRTKLGIQKDEIVFVYSGTLGKHWNNPDTYAKLIGKLRCLNSKHRFLFLTPDIQNLESTFEKWHISSSEYIAIHSNFEDVPLYLSVADFGLNIMEKQDIRLSIKTVEYLAAGLPIIINRNVLGAREIIEKYNVGMILEDFENINFEELSYFIDMRKEYSLKCKATATNLFSTKANATKYFDVYAQMI